MKKKDNSAVRHAQKVTELYRALFFFFFLINN